MGTPTSQIGYIDSIINDKQQQNVRDGHVHEALALIRKLTTG